MNDLTELFKAIFGPVETPQDNPEYFQLVDSLIKFKRDWDIGCEEDDATECKEDWVEGYLSMLGDALQEYFGLDTDLIDLKPHYGRQV